MLAFSVCVFLAALHARSAIAKIRQPRVFQTILNNYPLGSQLQRRGMSSLIPSLELLLAGALLIPAAPVRLAGCLGVLAFIASASAAIYVRRRRGEERFACGCAGNLEEQSDAGDMLLRNALLLAAACYAAAAGRGGGSAVDYALGAALLLAFDLAQAAMIQEGRVRNWKAAGSFRT
jgi:hypothetical protein